MQKSLDKCIHERRSVRKFTDEKVRKSDIEKIIKAAIKAPSGGNFQPWFFIAIQDQETLRNMNNIFSKRKDDKTYFFGANTIISVCVDMSKTYLKSSCKADIDRALDSIEIISVGAAIENMLLKITDIGLGACWCRVSCDVRYKAENLLGINPPHYLVANIAVGYPRGQEETTSRKSLNEVLRFI